MAETDTSPAALRALAENWASDKPAGVQGDDPDAIDTIVQETDAKMAETVAALRALAAEKEAGAPAPAPDGWIPWEGGECPMPDEVRVEIVLRDDDENQARAGILDWRHFNAPNDIMAYRIAKEG